VHELSILLLDEIGTGLNSKWVVAGLAYLVFRLYGRVQAHEAKINQLCKKSEIEPLAPEQK